MLIILFKNIRGWTTGAQITSQKNNNNGTCNFLNHYRCQKKSTSTPYLNNKTRNFEWTTHLGLSIAVMESLQHLKKKWNCVSTRDRLVITLELHFSDRQVKNRIDRCVLHRHLRRKTLELSNTTDRKKCSCQTNRRWSMLITEYDVNCPVGFVKLTLGRGHALRMRNE